MADLNEAIRLKPEYTDARALRGAIYYEADRWDDALEDFNAVLEKKPQEAQSLLGRAVILLKREDRAGAARDFKGFLSVRPDDPLAPKVRQLLASLKRGKEQPETEEPEPHAQNPEESPAPARHHHAAAQAPMSAEDLQRLADSLMSHPLSESYNRKVIRGEKAQAVGDINSVPGVADQPSSPGTEPQIVDPQ